MAQFISAGYGERDARSWTVAVQPDGDAVAAEFEFCTVAGIDRGAFGGAAIDFEAEARDRLNLEMATVGAGQPGMLRIDRKVGKMDGAGRVAPDENFCTIDRSTADNLPSIGGDGDAANEKRHRPALTSRRTR